MLSPSAIEVPAVAPPVTPPTPALPLFALDSDAVPDQRIAELAAADWDFRGVVTNGATHGFHPYPARFIPQIPAALIRALTRPGETVYDPFVGCGTSCVEAIIAGRRALGNDANRLAVLIAKAKTDPLPVAEEKGILATPARARKRVVAAESKTAVDIPESSRDWFEDFAACEVSAIKREIKKLRTLVARNFCFVALSAILVSVSRQDSDTRYVRVKKNLSPLDTIRRYERQLQKMLRMAGESRIALARGNVDIRVADSREPGIFADNSADFAVSSPPYPNAYDYHLYHRHRLLWLGMDPSELKRREIGAHAHYSRKNGMDENDFRLDMERVFTSAGRVLKRGKRFAVVIGDSILHGRRIRNSEIIKAAAATAGFCPVAEFRRRLDSRKKSFNPSHGNIAEENIVILKNDKRA